MALINAVTPADKRAFIYCIEDRESRWLSFASANQVLSGMIKNLPNNPKLIKTLDVDSAVEAIGWIDSPELLESITASDPRTGVADAVKSQMRKVASCVPTSVPNQHNIEERTRRLLSKHVSQWAELLTETEVSFKMVHDAVVELTDSDFELLATGVLPHSGLHESVGGFTARLASVLVKEGSNSPLLAHTLANSRACHNVMSAWDGNWNKAFGLMADRVFERNDTPHYLLRLKNDRLRNFSIDAECLDVWIAKGRLDFLCLTGEVTDDVVQDLVEKTSSLSDLVMALNLAAKPSYVDIMVEKMVALGTKWSDGVDAAIKEFDLPWYCSRLGARGEYLFQATAPKTGKEAADAGDFELEQYIHLRMLNEGFLITPFHNMALISPDTTYEDVDSHTAMFEKMCGDLTGK